MGFNPAENAQTLEMNGKAFAEYFKKKTGMNVKTFIATDYTALIEALRSGMVDFAWLPPFSYVKAEDPKIANAKLLLKSVRKGKSFFYSAIITRADKGFTKIEDLKGKNIAWVDTSSSSGHIVPKASLSKKLGVKPDELSGTNKSFFKKEVFAGSHDALVLAVLNGTVDAGATFSNDEKGSDGAWTQFLKGDDAKKIKVVYVTEPITGDTMTASNQVFTKNKDVVDLTVSTLISMGKEEEGKKILAALYRIDSMAPAKSEEYEFVRQAARTLGVMEKK